MTVKLGLALLGLGLGLALGLRLGVAGNAPAEEFLPERIRLSQNSWKRR